jgi:Holliday junction DNA helicase RuvA
MIVGLNGKIVHKEPSCVHIDVNGVVYEVFISLHSFSAVGSDKVSLFTMQIIREDANLLYGFVDMSEKKLFARLIKINGVGPKVAMAICSTYTPTQFGTILNNKDLKAVQKVPGIGPKSAGRILVELNGFDAEMLQTNSLSSASISYNEATEALESLGFKKDKISKALAACEADDTASLVKGALKFLQTI